MVGEVLIEASLYESGLRDSIPGITTASSIRLVVTIPSLSAHAYISVDSMISDDAAAVPIFQRHCAAVVVGSKRRVSGSRRIKYRHLPT